MPEPALVVQVERDGATRRGLPLSEVYHPRSGEIGDENQRGSLAIIHNESGGITFRHQFWIKRSDGEFVQWGATTARSSVHQVHKC